MFLENLESRQLFSISASVEATGALNVVGDAYNNGIGAVLSGDSRSILVQEYTGYPNDYVTRFSFPATSVSSIAMYGLGGADTLQVDSRITLPTGIWGGEGNDWLSGGAGSDYMVGGAGADTFYARDGSTDIIIGANEDGTGANYDVAQVDNGPFVFDWTSGIHALLP